MRIHEDREHLEGRGLATFVFPTDTPRMHGMPYMPRIHEKGHGTVYVDFAVDEDEVIGVPPHEKRYVLDAVARTIGFRHPVKVEVSYGGRRGIGGMSVPATYFIPAVQIAAKNALYNR